MEFRVPLSTSMQHLVANAPLPARSSSWLLGKNENGDVLANVMEVGEGRPIVFLHGLVGLNDHWEGVVERVWHRARCVLFELPLLQLRGEDCSISGATRMTMEFLRCVMKKPAILVGNSFGGHISLRVALEAPELVGGLVLAGSSGLLERTMVKEITVRPSREWMARKISELFYDKTYARQADVDRAYRELSHRAGAKAMVKLSRSARSDHMADRIGHITQPTLLIWGRQDVVTPPEAAEGFKEGIRDSRLVWIDHCGHAPMIEASEAFADALLSFCDELDRRTAARAGPTGTA